MSRVLSNLMSYAAALTGNVTITFPIKAKSLSIYNKSGSTELKFKFNTSENFVILTPTEIIEFDEISIRNLYLTSNGAEYKVVALG